jgi:hypothetical protein
MTPVIRSSTLVYHTTYDLLCKLLRRVLRDGVQAGPGTDEGIGSIQCRASAALYALLTAHPIDQQGRCRSCRRPGAVLGLRHRRCELHREASYWLRQPEELLHARLAHDWGLAQQPPTAAPNRDTTTGPTDPDTTDVLPSITPQTSDPHTKPLQTPALPPPPPPQDLRGKGGPDPTHGGTGDDPDGLRFRRVPPENSPPPQSSRSLLSTGDIT